jgi:hypothetical protein
LHEHLSQASPDLLRSLLTMMIDTLMSAEADAICGAEYGRSDPGRVNQRNGYRHRDFDTRTGTLDVAIPKLRSGDDPAVPLGSRQHLVIGGPAEAEVDDVQRIVAGLGEDACEIVLERLVDEEVHAVAGSGSVPWSTAAAANSRACWMSSSASWGKSALISLGVMPSSTMPTNVAMGIRVP